MQEGTVEPLLSYSGGSLWSISNRFNASVAPEAAPGLREHKKLTSRWPVKIVDFSVGGLICPTEPI